MKRLKKELNKIRELIAEDKLSLALISVKYNFIPSKYKNEIIVYFGRYNSIEQRYNNKTVTKEEYDVEINQIRFSLLMLLDKIEKDDEVKLAPIPLSFRLPIFFVILAFFGILSLSSFFIINQNQSLREDILIRQIKVERIDSLVNSYWLKRTFELEDSQILYFDSLDQLIAKDIFIENDTLKRRIFYDVDNPEHVIAIDQYKQDQNERWIKERSHYDEDSFAFMKEAFYKNSGLIYYKKYKHKGKYVEVGAGDFYSHFPWVFPVFYR